MDHRALLRELTEAFAPSGFEAAPAAILSRELRFIDAADGVTQVIDAADGTVVAELPPGKEGFVRGVLRATARQRHSREVADDAPYRLAQLADGRLTLTDLGTGQVIELSSFGATNVAAFAAFFGGKAPEAARNALPAQVGQTGGPL